MLWLVKASINRVDSASSDAVLRSTPGLFDRRRDATACKDSRLIEPIIKYPSANQSASIGYPRRKIHYQHATTAESRMYKSWGVMIFTQKSEDQLLFSSSAPVLTNKTFLEKTDSLRQKSNWDPRKVSPESPRDFTGWTLRSV